MRIFLTLALAVLLPNAAFARDLPDKTRTPGVANPDVTQDNIDQTICVSGWTKTIRPPSSYTSNLKVEQIKEYGYKDKKPGDYEEDHLISTPARSLAGRGSLRQCSHNGSTGKTHGSK